MDWDKLRIFNAVADAGSFTHAGRDLGLSQSAVSRQIQALEQDLNITLFRRHARGLILTEQGETLHRAAHEISTKMAETKARLTDSKNKPAGDLTLTTTVGLGSIWLTPRLAQFCEVYPDINISLLLHNRELDLTMREADIAIRLRRPTQPDLIQRRLFTVHFHLYAAPEYLHRHGIPEKTSDLDNHKILSYGTAPSYLSNINWLQTIDRPSSKPRPVALHINNVYGIRRAVEEGIGIASLPDYIVSPHSPLVRIDINAEAPEFDTYFVYPEELRQSKRVAVFRDFIVARAKEWEF